MGKISRWMRARTHARARAHTHTQLHATRNAWSFQSVAPTSTRTVVHPIARSHPHRVRPPPPPRKKAAVIPWSVVVMYALAFSYMYRRVTADWTESCMQQWFRKVAMSLTYCSFLYFIVLRLANDMFLQDKSSYKIILLRYGDILLEIWLFDIQPDFSEFNAVHNM